MFDYVLLGLGVIAIGIVVMLIAILTIIIAYVSFARGRSRDEARPSNT